MKAVWVLIILTHIDTPLETFESYSACGARVNDLLDWEVTKTYGRDDPKYQELKNKLVWNYECHKLRVPK